jgi:hypothetical protein
MDSNKDNHLNENLIYPIVKGVLGSIPIAGSAMTAAFDIVFTTP